MTGKWLAKTNNVQHMTRWIIGSDNVGAVGQLIERSLLTPPDDMGLNPEGPGSNPKQTNCAILICIIEIVMRKWRK